MTPPRRPHPNGAKCAFYLFFIQKFRPPFQRWRGRGAVRQRKFGFQTKLPGRKRPSSGVFSGFQPEARFARRPLSLPCGLGVGDPSPQAPPRWGKVRFLPVLYPKVSSTFSKVAGSRGRAPGALRTASRSEAFRAQPAEGGLLARDERGTPYPVKRIFRVNCRRRAARGCFLQVKKHPATRRDTAPAQDAQMILFSGLSAAAERAGLKNIKTGGRDITRRIFKEVSPWEW